MHEHDGGRGWLQKLVDDRGRREEMQHLLYLSAEWCAPVDALTVPHLKQLVQSQSAPSHLVYALRSDDSDAPRDDSDADYRPELLDPETFRSLCRHFDVSRLPMCLVLDQELRRVPYSSTSSHSTRTSTHGDDVFAFARSMQDTANSHDWVGLSTHEPRLNNDDTVLVALREQSLNLFESGQFMVAAQHFERVLLRCPECPKAHFNLAVIFQMIGELYFATHHMLRVVDENDQDAVAHTVLRSVLYPQEPDAVLAGYEAIIARHPDHARASHSLATLRGDATSAAPTYVKQVFDDLADTFEEKLVMHLEYRVPWQLVDALQRVHALPAELNLQHAFHAIDLGCGTGLCGRLLRPFVDHITGIDLSPLMIEKTRELGGYDELTTADIIPFLASRPDHALDLVISADVWIYVGALDSIFPLVAQKLAQGKWFAFSVELLPSGDSFQLASSGRFQHSENYIATLAKNHGFTIRVNDAIEVRKESGEPIKGRNYVLQARQ